MPVVLLVTISTPPAVNTPRAITGPVFEVAEVDMNRNCSTPEAAAVVARGAAVAATMPDRAIAAGAAAASPSQAQASPARTQAIRPIRRM